MNCNLLGRKHVELARHFRSWFFGQLYVLSFEKDHVTGKRAHTHTRTHTQTHPES